MEPPFCIVPKQFSPFNAVHYVTQADEKTRTDYTIHTAYQPLKRIVVPLLLSLLSSLSFTQVVKQMNRQLMDIEDFGEKLNLQHKYAHVLVVLQLLASVSTSALTMYTTFFDLARARYSLFEKGLKIAEARSGFTRTFKWAASVQDLRTGQKCSLTRDKNNLYVHYGEQKYALPLRPPNDKATPCCGGYVITSRDPKSTLVKALPNGFQIKPLNVVHSRVFCVHRDEEQEAPHLPVSLLTLLLYFWEHNGTVAVVNLLRMLPQTFSLLRSLETTQRHIRTRTSQQQHLIDTAFGLLEISQTDDLTAINTAYNNVKADYDQKYGILRCTNNMGWEGVELPSERTTSNCLALQKSLFDNLAWAKTVARDFVLRDKKKKAAIFRTLGLPPDASRVDVKKQFKFLSLFYHPDKCDLSEKAWPLDTPTTNKPCAIIFAKLQNAYANALEFFDESKPSREGTRETPSEQGTHASKEKTHSLEGSVEETD